MRDVKTAEVILREYETDETATNTRFSSFKASKGFGNTGKIFSVSRIFGLPHFDKLLVMSRRLYFARVTTILSKSIIRINPN